MPRILLYLSCCLLPTWALGQCCSPGNPIGGSINPGVNQAGRGQVLLGYRYGYAGRYFEGDQATEATFIRAGDYQHLSVTGTFGLSERLTLAVETGYVLYKRQWYVAGVRPAELRGSGLTDLTALVRVNWLRDEARGWEFTMELGPKFPLGSYRQAVDGIRLPRDLQPSTGAMELVHTTFLQKAFLAQKYRLFLLSRFELKAQNPEGYRYGPWLALAAFASYAPFARWTLLGQLRQEWRGRDSRPFTGQGFDLGNGREAVPPTGSYKLFAAPQVGFQPTPDWQVTLLAEWPLYQHYQEQQLATSFSALIGVAYWWGKG